MNYEETVRMLNTSVPTGEFVEPIDKMTLLDAKSKLQEIVDLLAWDKELGEYIPQKDIKLNSELKAVMHIIARLI